MIPFNPEDYGPAAAELLVPERIAELGPGSPNVSVRPRLENLDAETLCPPQRRIADRSMAACCCAALWLYHDFLDASHKISQNVDTPSGSYWHGIMHRREGDFSNSKYWLRRVGHHPTFAALSDAARQRAAAGKPDPSAAFLGEQREWDPFRWIDLCEQQSDSNSSTAELCRHIQHEEWIILFDYCFRRAFAAG